MPFLCVANLATVEAKLATLTPRRDCAVKSRIGGNPDTAPLYMERTMIKNGMRPIHPGEILREEFLEPLEMSANALSLELHVPAPRINDIVREKRAVSTDTAMRLARYFGTTPQFWLNLQTAFDLKVAEAEVGAQIMRDVPRREEIAA